MLFPGYQPSPYWRPYWICTQHPTCQWCDTFNPWNKCPKRGLNNGWAHSYWEALPLFLVCGLFCFISHPRPMWSVPAVPCSHIYLYSSSFFIIKGTRGGNSTLYQWGSRPGSVHAAYFLPTLQLHWNYTAHTLHFGLGCNLRTSVTSCLFLHCTMHFLQFSWG